MEPLTLDFGVALFFVRIGCWIDPEGTQIRSASSGSGVGIRMPRMFMVSLVTTWSISSFGLFLSGAQHRIFPAAP